MHAFAVLAEIVRAGPNFFFFRTIYCNTTVTFVHDILRGYFVYAFFMSVQIVLCAESFVSCTIVLLAFERFRMPNLVLSVKDVSLQVQLVMCDRKNLILTSDLIDS